MGEVRLSLTGISAEGRHGASPGERDRPQAFLVDFDVVLEVDADTLEATLDYRSLAQLVRDTVGGPSMVLLESIAEEVATVIFAHPTVREVTVAVHKPEAAERLGVDDISAEVTLGG